MPTVYQSWFRNLFSFYEWYLSSDFNPVFGIRATSVVPPPTRFLVDEQQFLTRFLTFWLLLLGPGRHLSFSYPIFDFLTFVVWLFMFLTRFFTFWLLLSDFLCFLPDSRPWATLVFFLPDFWTVRDLSCLTVSVSYLALGPGATPCLPWAR